MKQVQPFKKSNDTNVRILVLVVDDDPVQVEEIVEFLNNRGILTAGETKADTALEIIFKENPALVIVDINMPSIDGLHLTELLRTRRYPGVILLMSGDLDAVRKANFLHAKAFAVLEKPIPLKALERYARGVIDRKPGTYQ